MRKCINQIIEDIRDGDLPYDHPFKAHQLACVLPTESANGMKRYLKWLKKHKPAEFQRIINQANELGLRPLLIALGNRYGLAKRYVMGIDLLEAGAEPFLLYRGPGSKANVFNVAIDDDNLMAARLVLWYDPNYESLRSRDGKIAMMEWLDQIQWIHDEEARKGKRHPNINLKKLLAETAADAREVIRLRAEAESAHGLSNHLMAAKAYDRIAQIFIKQQAIEAELPYPMKPSIATASRVQEHAELREKKRVILNFYKQKAKQYGLLAYKAYEAEYTRLRRKPQKSTEDLERLREVVDSLIELSESFRWHYARWYYNRERRHLVTAAKDELHILAKESDIVSSETEPFLAQQRHGLFRRKALSRVPSNSDTYATESISKFKP